MNVDYGIKILSAIIFTILGLCGASTLSETILVLVVGFWFGYKVVGGFIVDTIDAYFAHKESKKVRLEIFINECRGKNERT